MDEVSHVYIVDDDHDLRRSLVELLVTRTPWSVTPYADGNMWLGSESREVPGCVLLDHSMPGITGLAVLQQMTLRRSAHQVVMLTGEGDIQIAVAAMRHGAVDFLEKPAPFAQIQASLVMAFERLNNANSARSRTDQARAKLARLRPRERDVMSGLIEGMPNKVIAHQLGLSVRTVELYRAALMDRLNVHSVAELLKIAYAADFMAN